VENKIITTAPSIRAAYGEMNERNGEWMQTYSGYQFWPLDPRPEEIHVIDIAHALANQCRYGGHCRTFYSVAQHSVIVSRIVPPQDALWGLLHDAAEAYLVDLPRPIKRFSEMGSAYRAIEGRLMRVVCERFGLAEDEPESVHLADNVVLMTEKRDLMPGLLKWAETAQPLDDPIIPVTPEVAEGEFLRRAGELGIKWSMEPGGNEAAGCLAGDR